MSDGELCSILTEKQLDGGHANEWLGRLNAVTREQVREELSKPAGVFSLERLTALVSPAAGDLLEEMAQQAHRLTIQRFGRTMQMFAPLYVSNVCINSCRYCGYNCKTKITRVQLSIEQAMADAEVIADEGFRNLLLVSGEDRQFVTMDYLCELARRLRGRFSTLSAEIYPLSEEEYRQLFAGGIDGITMFQETYDRQVYAHYHPAGPKRDYDNRVTSPDRFALAGMRRFGLGVLLGLADWRLEALALGQHAAHLMRRYWRGQVSFSFPRLRPATKVGTQWPHLVSDKEMVQMMLALRLCFSDAGIVLSTRESADLRNHLINLCVTSVSAGSKTNPGGYSSRPDASEQFEVADSRTAGEVAAMLRAHGYEPIWKDWDAAFCAE
ncbi:MAG: 2-iminoacetate synthase ThiH [Planctomycetaceae bacterium]|nr:2-iminoacetate synthase ThiH [Planctomycetaceae bacterium]